MADVNPAVKQQQSAGDAATTARKQLPWALLVSAMLLVIGLTWEVDPSGSRSPLTAVPSVDIDADPAVPRPPEAKEPPHEYAADGIPIQPSAAAGSAFRGPMHPHPITEAHERIYRENNLVGALDLAVDLEDAPRIRQLVAEYRQQYPEDAHHLQDGYAMIGQCLEHLDEATRKRARRFWETEIRSQTRRYVRRYCLER